MKKLFEFDEHIGDWRVLVQSRDIQNGAVTTDKISDGAVTTNKIADKAVTTEKIADGAVTGEKIKDHAITPQQLPEDFEVTERMIADQAIGTDKIADNAVTTPKIANQAVTTEKIADQNVTEEKLAPGAVTTEKLADDMIEQLETITDAEPTPDSVKPLQSGGAASVLGHYIENPEFVRVVTDKDDKVLYGVQADGNFYFGAGCPQQVKDYIQQKIDTIMGVGDVTEKIDTINEMIAFFEGIRNDETLRQLLETSAASIAAEKARAEAAEQALDNAKVDKKEGKNLIDAEYANGVHYIENPEFAEIKLDNKGRILESINIEGRKFVYVEIEYLELTRNCKNKLQDDLGVNAKMSIPSASTANNIAIFDEHGNVKDSGYNVNNIPATLPSGGSSGEVLGTDGNGHYYWTQKTSVNIHDEILDQLDKVVGVIVDDYESHNTGLSWTPAIQKAVNEAGEGGVIIFSPDKTYPISDTIFLKKNQTIIGNHATLFRMAETKATIVTTGETASVEVSEVPSDWKVGDNIMIYTQSTGATINDRKYSERSIAAINGNVVTLNIPVIVESGWTMLKSWVMLFGEQYPDPVSYKIFNLCFDGNKDNNTTTYDWYCHGTIYAFSYGTIISGCKFINISNENIVTQGAVVENCYAENLNGSFVHLSCPKAARLTSGEKYMGTFISNNICKNVNIIDNSITGHSEGPVTFSWNPGKLVVHGNQFYGGGGSYCLQMDFYYDTHETDQSESQGGYIIYIGNIFENYRNICPEIKDPHIVFNGCKLVTNNIFKDCGISDFTHLYRLDLRFEDNLLIGNTVVYTGGNAELYRVNTEFDYVPSATILTGVFEKLPIGGEVYLPQVNKLYKKVAVGNEIRWLDIPYTLVN